MARIRISYTWADGDSLCVSVDAGKGYPDALDEARVTARKLWDEEFGKMVSRIEADEDGD